LLRVRPRQRHRSLLIQSWHSIGVMSLRRILIPRWSPTQRRFPQMETESVAYVLIRSGKLYVITFTAKPDRVGPFFEQASEIMRNFTVR
jgi:hypothetical protein